MPRLVATVVSASLMLALMPFPVHGQDADPCEGWTVRDVASGLGVIENLEPDGDGGMFIASGDDVLRVLPDGSSSRVATLDRLGGMRVRGPWLYVNTGNGLQSGLFGTPDGTLTRVHRTTGEIEVVASGLVMPNGLVFDDDGNAYTSRDVSLDIADQLLVVPDEAAISRIDSAGVVSRWAEIADTNGLAIDPTGTWMYAATTFNLQARVIRIRMDDPTVIETVASLLTAGAIPVKGLDDLDIDDDGILYITANPAGQVVRLDPGTGEACVIADGLLLASAVKFGRGPGWSEDNLYVVTWQGGIHELIPPGGSPGAPDAGSVDQPRPADDPSAAPSSSLPDTGGGGVLAALAVLAGAGMRRRVSRRA